MTNIQPARFVAEYQMFGDMEGLEWGNLIFNQAKQSNQVLDFEILSSVTGTFGIQLITFTVDLSTPVSEFRDTQEAMDWAQSILCGIVNDSDVEVRWVGAVPQEVKI